MGTFWPIILWCSNTGFGHEKLDTAMKRQYVIIVGLAQIMLAIEYLCLYVWCMYGTCLYSALSDAGCASMMKVGAHADRIFSYVTAHWTGDRVLFVDFEDAVG